MSPQETAEHLNKRGAESWATTTVTLLFKKKNYVVPCPAYIVAVFEIFYYTGTNLERRGLAQENTT